MTLTTAQVAACAAIIKAPEAWMKWDELVEKVGEEVLGALVGAGLIEPWDRPDYRAVTLTPYGAAVNGVEVDEAWRPATEDHEERDESKPLAGATIVRERVLTETPVWVTRGQTPRPVRLPRHGRIGTGIVRLENVAAPEAEPEPELLLNGDGQPVRLFAGRDEGGPNYFPAKTGEPGGLTVRVGRKRRAV